MSTGKENVSDFFFQIGFYLQWLKGEKKIPLQIKPGPKGIFKVPLEWSAFAKQCSLVYLFY